jgi:hypothetical protein
VTKLINWPNEVISDIARRRCVLFLGSGVSINSVNKDGRRPKTWKSFLESSLSGVKPSSYIKHIKKLIKENDYLTACEVIKKSLGKDAFNILVRDEFLLPGFLPAEIHEEIFKLDSRIVATPNFDKIYETYANTKANGTIVVKHHYDQDVASVVRESGRIILKVHGTIDSPEHMIFTRSEYASARTKHSTFYEILSALSLTHTFVFIGCGINDPDIKLLLEDTFFRHNSFRSHIILLPNNVLHDSVANILQETMNLKVIKYSSKDNHKELMDSLKSLNISVDAFRVELAKDLNW